MAGEPKVEAIQNEGTCGIETLLKIVFTSFRKVVAGRSQKYRVLHGGVVLPVPDLLGTLACPKVFRSGDTTPLRAACLHRSLPEAHNQGCA